MAGLRTDAFAAHKQGNLVRAEQLYKDLLRSAPNDAEIMHTLVLCVIKPAALLTAGLGCKKL